MCPVESSRGEVKVNQVEDLPGRGASGTKAWRPLNGMLQNNGLIGKGSMWGKKYEICLDRQVKIDNKGLQFPVKRFGC